MCIYLIRKLWKVSNKLKYVWGVKSRAKNWVELRNRSKAIGIHRWRRVPKVEEADEWLFEEEERLWRINLWIFGWWKGRRCIICEAHSRVGDLHFGLLCFSLGYGSSNGFSGTHHYNLLPYLRLKKKKNFLVSKFL